MSNKVHHFLRLDDTMMAYHLVRFLYFQFYLYIVTNQPKWNRKIKFGNQFIYNYIQTLPQSFQTMGNVHCGSGTLVEGQANQKIERYDTNTTFEEDYSPYIDSKQKNAKTEQIIKIRSLGILKGSKQLQFGLENYPSRQRVQQKIRSLGKSIKKQTNNQSRTHLEPIVFSIIDFSVTSDDSQNMIYQNAIDMPSQRYDKFLSSTREYQDEGTNVQKATCDYLLNFVEWTPNVEVSKEQFIRIKKTNIENEYLLNQKMGEGSFGEVYKCIHKATNQIRAVKILKRNLLINPKIKQQFLQQFSILKKLDHPNIVKIFQIYEFKNSVSIVSQFCEGNSLGSYIKNNMKLNPQTKMEILRQIFLGVNYLHHMKVIHRDLKPQNIVFINPLTPQTTPEQVDLRIIDFGLAIEQKEAIFKDWANIGTYNFMAPQVFQGIYSNKCDSWACGVIAYILLMGFNPYRGHEIEEVKKKIKTFSPKISDFKNIEFSAIDLMLNLTKVNYVIRWDIGEALNSEYFGKIQTKIDKKDVFQRLSSYKNNNSLVSVIQSYLTFKKMNQNDQSALRKHFNQININKNGTISVEQLHRYFDGVQRQEIQRYFKRIDKNRSGGLDFGQFSAAMSSRKQLFTQQNLRQVFDAIDFNKKGKLTKQQIRYFLRSFDRSSINDLISQINQNNSDFITFQQFSAYLKKDQWV